MQTNYTANIIRSETPLIRPLQTPKDHVRVLHGGLNSFGRVEVAVPRPGHWHGVMIPLASLGRYCASAAAANNNSDVYLSQGRFHGRRRIVNLSSINSLWIDLDFYKSEFAQDSPASVTRKVRYRCTDLGIPEPSYVIFSGRGLCCVWLVDELPRRALPRWNLVEKALLSKFLDMGADRAASDAARVFRLIGSRHARADQIVRCIYPLQGDPEVYSFDQMADALLPYTRAQIQEFRRQGATKKRTVDRGSIRDLQKQWNATTKAGALWERRLEDLQKLKALRFFGPLPEGQRDLWIFVASCALTFLAPVSKLEREILELARQATGEHGWSEGETLRQMGTVIRKAKKAAKGNRIDHAGQTVDPRYKFKTETIRALLDITHEEETAANLQTIVSPERKSVLQSERGKQSGRARRQSTQERNQAIRAAYSRGEKQTALVVKYGLSKMQIHRILNPKETLEKKVT